MSMCLGVWGWGVVLRYHFSCRKIAHSALRFSTLYEYFSQMIFQKNVEGQKAVFGRLQVESLKVIAHLKN